MRTFKFLSNIEQPPLEPHYRMERGHWGILYRDRQNNLFLDDVLIDGYQYSTDENIWIEYDTGFITMEFFFFSFRHTFNYSLEPNHFLYPIVTSIEHNDIVYDLRNSHVRRMINVYTWTSTDIVRIKGKKLRHV